MRPSSAPSKLPRSGGASPRGALTPRAGARTPIKATPESSTSSLGAYERIVPERVHVFARVRPPAAGKSSQVNLAMNRVAIAMNRVAISMLQDPMGWQIIVDEDMSTLTLPAAPPIRPNAKSLAFDRVFPVGYPQAPPETSSCRTLAA